MRIFFDVDTQNDFMNKDGALYVSGAEKIKSNLALLTNYAIKSNIPILGDVDIHFGTEEYKERETELQKWGGLFPDHCMDRTKGQEKISQTTLWVPSGMQGGGDEPGGIYIHNFLTKQVTKEQVREEMVELAKKHQSEFLLSEEHINNVYEMEVNGIDSWGIKRALQNIELIHKELKPGYSKYKQEGIYFEKQCYDVFSNPNIEILLKKAGVTEAVVYGVATDYCVKAAVLGMQVRGVQCYVVEDAIKGVADNTTKSALEEMLKAGAQFVKTKDVLAGGFKRLV